MAQHPTAAQRCDRIIRSTRNSRQKTCYRRNDRLGSERGLGQGVLSARTRELQRAVFTRHEEYQAFQVDVSIKEGRRDRRRRTSRLVNSNTRAVLTARDVTEGAIRRFFEQLGADPSLVDSCLEVARKRYAARESSDDLGLEGGRRSALRLGLDDS